MPQTTRRTIALGMRHVDLVVLDMAGTTVEDHGEVRDAFAAALAMYGVHVGAQEITRIRGASKRQDLCAASGSRGEVGFL
jgi:hypothetical protein